MQNIFSNFFSPFPYSDYIFFCFIVLETSLSSRPLFAFCKIFENAVRFNRTYAYTHTQTHICAHADACKHLLCVHNAAKYSLDFSALSNFLPRCMPFRQDAKVPQKASVAFEGCYLFLSMNILPKHKQNRYILLLLHLNILMSTPSTIRI